MSELLLDGLSRPWEIRQGDVLDRLREMPDESVHCCVTSPPYFGLRSYLPEGHPDKHMELGAEKTPEEYVAKMVEMFREVRRVLRRDGTLWLNIGDSMRDKNLAGIPWRMALALQADGWVLRSDIIWHKPSPMPESVRDRPTKSHEYIFLLSKSKRYHYDADAIAEDAIKGSAGSRFDTGKTGGHQLGRASAKVRGEDGKRNKRTVWTVSTTPFKGAHFATFPVKLITPCILAGCPENGIVLDPFAGAATTMLAATQLGRRSIGIEMNPEYVALAERRLLAPPKVKKQARKKQTVFASNPMPQPYTTHSLFVG